MWDTSYVTTVSRSTTKLRQRHPAIDKIKTKRPTPVFFGVTTKPLQFMNRQACIQVGRVKSEKTTALGPLPPASQRAHSSFSKSWISFFIWGGGGCESDATIKCLHWTNKNIKRKKDFKLNTIVNGCWYPVAEPAPEGAEEAVGAVPQAVDEPHVRRREVEWTDNLKKRWIYVPLILKKSIVEASVPYPHLHWSASMWLSRIRDRIRIPIGNMDPHPNPDAKY